MKHMYVPTMEEAEKASKYIPDIDEDMVHSLIMNQSVWFMISEWNTPAN